MARKTSLQNITSPAKRTPISQNFKYLADEIDIVEGSLQPQVDSLKAKDIDLQSQVTSNATDIASLAQSHKYFWQEEKTILSGNNSFTLTNTVEPHMTLEIYDRQYGCQWFSPENYTINGQIVTLTETALSEDLTFIIKAV